MDDLELLSRCVAGEEGAWERFTEQYSRLIYSSILRVLRTYGVSSHGQDLTKEIFQDIISSLLRQERKKLKSFKALNGCSVATWLRQVAINAAIDHLRRRKEMLSLDQENEDGLALKDLIADDAGSAAEELVAKEQLSGLQDCIQALDISDRYIVQQHFYYGARLEDLRGQLKLSRGAMDMQKSRLLRRLRECFRKKGFALDI
jgi:RNA polymerase sigma-70 factor (ECF subfamily)